MKIVDWQELLAGDRDMPDRDIPGPVAATIGVFDGIHVGHQKLMRAITAGGSGLTPVVVTFRANPAAVLSPDLSQGSILTPRQKNRKLSALGVGAVILIDFSHEFSTLTGRTFIQQLRSCLDLRKIVVGYNFHFGRNRDTDASGLTRMLEGSGIEVEVIQPTLYENEVVSSSRLRNAILAGRFDQARRMLAADYTIDLVALGDLRRVGETVSIPRSRLSQLMPKEGLYPAVLQTETGGIPTKVSVSSQALSWKTDDRRKVNEIRFVEAD